MVDVLKSLSPKYGTSPGGRAEITLSSKFQIKIDLIAERVLTLDGIPLHAFEDYIKYNQLEIGKNIHQDEKAIELIISSLAKLLALERDILKKSGNIDDEGTNSMMGENLKNTDIFVNQSTVTISEAAALWRGEGLDDYQSPHADGESGPFSMPVKSLCHKQEIWGEKKSIQWFGGREGVDMNVTDLSIHFTIDSTGSAMHCNASHTTGSTEILRVNVIDKENDDLEEYSKWKFTNQCNIENALKRYEERTRGPEICDLAGPCLNFRQETDYILECFKVGKTPNLRASRHRGCNNRD